MRRFGPIAVALAALVVGYLVVFGVPHPHHGSAAAFVAYRGRHRIGDLIGPNARVVAVDGNGNPTAVVSTDGRPPVVWSFELAAPADLRPIRGSRVRTLDRQLWAHPACPSAMCTAGSRGSPLAAPPPPLALDPCPSVDTAALIPLLGPGPFTTTSPRPGTCVWDNGRAGMEVEVGGPAWWPYLAARFTPMGAALVDTHRGLHLAVHRGGVTAVLLTYTRPSASSWLPIAEEAAAWAVSHSSP